jgi:MarR family transcriptional repressor of emrRAB
MSHTNVPPAGGEPDAAGGEPGAAGGGRDATAGATGAAEAAAPAAAREANLFGALTLAVAERLARATDEAAARGGAAPAALNALESYLDGSSIDALRHSLGLTHSAGVRLVDRLAADGFLTRQPGEDGRSVAVTLTAAGREVARQVRESRERALVDVLGALSAGEREQLSSLHEKLLEGITGSRADARHICRLCDPDACGHHEGRCPVTRAADRAARSGRAS